MTSLRRMTLTRKHPPLDRVLFMLENLLVYRMSDERRRFARQAQFRAERHGERFRRDVWCGGGRLRRCEVPFDVV